MIAPVNRPLAQRGAVLILVLWITALLTVMLAAFSQQVRIDRSVAGDTLDRVRAQAASESVLNYLAALQQVDPEGFQQMPGELYRLPWGGLEVRFRLLPESAFVSLNTAPLELLELVFAGLGLAEPLQLAEAVVRRREGDPEAVDELQREPRPWLSVDELVLLGGGLQQQPGLSALFTAHGRHVEVDARFASAELVALLETSPFLLTPEADEGVVGEVYRVQIEIGSAQRSRKLEASVRFSSFGRTGYQLLQTNLYNVSFELY